MCHCELCKRWLKQVIYCSAAPLLPVVRAPWGNVNKLSAGFGQGLLLKSKATQ